jgi:hypothetical protein
MPVLSFTDDFTDLDNFTSGRYLSAGPGSGPSNEPVTPLPTLADDGLDLSSTNFGSYGWYDSEGACPANTQSIEVFFEFSGMQGATDGPAPTFNILVYLFGPDTELILKSNDPDDPESGDFDRPIQTTLRADPPNEFFGGVDQVGISVIGPQVGSGSGVDDTGSEATYHYGGVPEVSGRLQFKLNNDGTGSQSWAVTPGGSGSDTFAFGEANGPMLEGIIAAFSNQNGGVSASGRLTKWGYVIVYDDPGSILPLDSAGIPLIGGRASLGQPGPAPSAGDMVGGVVRLRRQ